MPIILRISRLPDCLDALWRNKIPVVDVGPSILKSEKPSNEVVKNAGRDHVNVVRRAEVNKRDDDGRLSYSRKLRLKRTVRAHIDCLPTPDSEQRDDTCDLVRERV